jgi:signal transduction histidine kinase
MRANSLALRLVLSSAVIACTLLVAAGLLLGTVFQRALERNFDQRLEAVMDGLLANVTLKEDGTPELTDPIADTRFVLAESGWYWQVSPPPSSDANALLSQSLLGSELDVPQDQAKDTKGISRFYLFDRKAQQLRAIAQGYKLFNGKEPYTFMVAGNFDELQAEVRSFRNTLYTVLGMLGLGLLGAILFQVRFGLRPMDEMQRKLSAIRNGEAEKLDGNFPSEMQPVADELNLLIRSNREIIERARMQVGNLAHALKTPISVLTNEAASRKQLAANKVREQVDLMRQQIDNYLERARAATRAQALGTACDVETVVQGIARTLPRIYRDREFDVSVNVAPGLRFRGERQDLEEILGNLLDNAGKWTRTRISVTATRHEEAGRHWVLIHVDDDGPGIPEDKRDIAMKRGQRLDENKPGSGLGLNIVAETAALYGGQLDLASSPLGGLRAALTLPAAQNI